MLPWCRLGLAEGTIVKASCLAPGANILLDAALSDEVPAGEVAAAAAEVTAMLEDAVPQPGCCLIILLQAICSGPSYILNVVSCVCCIKYYYIYHAMHATCSSI